MLALTAKALLTPVKRIEQPLLLIEGASVVEIRSQREAEVPANSRKLDFKDCVLAPGLIDIHIHGSAGHDVLIGGSDADVLIGGNGDTLTGGLGPDTFVFRPNFGTNVITDFNVIDEAVQIDKSIFAIVNDLLAHTTDTAAGAVINDGHGDAITLAGVTLSQLQAHQNDFHLVLRRNLMERAS